jgi:hypothetical protein
MQHSDSGVDSDPGDQIRRLQEVQANKESLFPVTGRGGV